MAKDNRFTGMMAGLGKKPKPSSEPVQVKQNKSNRGKCSSEAHVRTTVYLTKELHKRMKVYGVTEDMELSEIAEQAISEWLDKHHKA